MPKTSRKPRKKIVAVKQSDDDVRRQISAAVDELSKMAAAQVTLNNPSPVKRGTRGEVVAEQFAYSNRKDSARILLWIGVTVLTTAILGFWLVNIQSIFTDIRLSPASNERNLLQEAKADINAAMEWPEKQTPAETEAAVRAGLKEILNP